MVLREYGFEFVLNQFKEELDLLESENGMLLNAPDMPGFRLRGTVICLCEDTKGAHELGDYEPISKLSLSSMFNNS